MSMSVKADLFDNLSETAATGMELKKAVSSRSMPHALLFTGRENSGREKAAFTVAMALNCAEPDFTGPFFHIPCRRCRSCEKIASGMHPDIITVSPHNNLIRISAVRELYMSAVSKPNEAQIKTVVIRDAQLMNHQAQNALLKLLEEPPEDTVFILTADSVNSLLPTVISRCRHIRFAPVATGELQKILENNYAVSPEMARAASGTAEGDVRKALMFLNIGEDTGDTDWIGRRKWILEELAALFEKNGTNSVNRLKGLLLAEKLSEETASLPESIAVIRTFIRDLAVVKLTPDKTVNIDLNTLLQKLSGRIPMTDILSWIKVLYETEKRIELHTSARLALENFFLKLTSYSKA